MRARLARLEKGLGARKGWIEAKLSPETKLLLMEHHLLLHGEEDALAQARDLHARKERRPLAPPPIPHAVEEQLEAWSEETRLHHEAIPAEARIALEHAQAERQALAKRYLDEASAEHQAA
jgi:hypothetical protein